MEQKKKGLVAVAGVFGCLFVGAGLEHVRLALASPEAEEAQPETVAAKRAEAQPVRTLVVTNDADARAANEALRKRLAELEQALAARPAEPEQPPVETAPPPEERPRRQSFTERLEQMKKENPEQYAEMQKRREEFRQTMEQRAQDRAEFASAIDTRNMSDEQKANHEKLLDTVARVNELMAQMGAAEGDRRSDLRQEMGEAMHSLGELYGTERRYLFEETARAVGYTGDQVGEFADSMQTIIDNTTMSGFGRHGGHGNAGGPAAGGAPAAAGETH